MKTFNASPLFLVALLVLLVIPFDALAEEGTVVIGVGHSRKKSFGKIPFESKPTVTSSKPGIASATWTGEESGTLVITGVEEGTAEVTVKGKVRVVNFNNGRRLVTVKPYSASVTVKVIKSQKYTKLAVIYVKQSMTVKFPKDLRLRTSTVKNSNRRCVFVKSRTAVQITFRGKRAGESWLTFTLVKTLKDGTKKKVPGNILVRVLDKKPKKNERHVSIGWDDLYIGEIILVNPGPDMDEHGQPKKKDKRIGMLQDWPGQEGVYCSFQASGRNYGVVGDLTIENETDKPVTVTVPPGLLLDSSDPEVQDLYVADVPTEEPCSGAKEIDKPITVAPNTSYSIKDVPGFCPDAEKDPPASETGGESVYSVCKPDEKSTVLLDTIAAVKKLDVGALKLGVFEKDKARAMVCQGALWQVDSQVDEEKGNECTPKELNTKFFEAFTASAKDTLEKMPEKKREKVETVVKDDIKKIVDAADFISKKCAKDGLKKMKLDSGTEL